MQTALLCIDDDPEDLDLFCEAVNTVDPDIVCYTADGGRKGITQLNGMVELPSFIFLDLQMHEMDGLASDADVIFLLTSNRPDLLEPALAARPGRAP